MEPIRKPQSRKLSPAERREYVALGVKAGKSLRLLAEQLGVTDATIRRDLLSFGITGNKKPAVTRRKKAAVWKTSSKKAAENKALENQKVKRFRTVADSARARPKRRKKIALPERPKLTEPTKLSPEQRRQQRLEEMVDLIDSWLAEHRQDYLHRENVLDKAKNRLKAKPGFYVQQLPDSSLSAAELLAKTRPEEMDSARLQSISRREEVCALWLARWLAAWAPHDEDLRDAVLNQARSRLRVR